MYNKVTRKLARQLRIILRQWDFRTPVVEEFFILTCNDIIAGVPLNEIYVSINLFEELEEYEECEGILLACELCTVLTMQIYLNKDDDE
jgi:hypothetical protein